MTSKLVGIEASLAVSEAVRLANVDVIAAYPITPQTHIVENLAEQVAMGGWMQNIFQLNPSILL